MSCVPATALAAPSSPEVVSGLAEALRAQPDAPFIEKWLQLARREVAFAEFTGWARQQRRLSCLSLDVTSVCDLLCEGMCYYHPDISPRSVPVAEGALLGSIAEAERLLGLRCVTFAGKEPLLNPTRLFSLLEALGPRAMRGYSVGAISNGRRLSRHWARLRDLSERGRLDFLDISLDSGIPAQHDAIRGRPGTFAAAFGALQEARQQLPGTRVGVSSVLREDNEDGLLQLLERASPWTRHFFVTPIQPPPYSRLPPLAGERVVRFLRRLQRSMATSTGRSEVEVTVFLPGVYVDDAAQAGLFEWHRVRETAEGMVCTQPAPGAPLIYYSLSVLPEQAWRHARILSDGAYLPHLHFLQAPVPRVHAIGFVQNESIGSLYERSVADGSPFARIAATRATHECRGRPCWAACFGGWTVAENALLTGETLESQPRLCTKERLA